MIKLTKKAIYYNKKDYLKEIILLKKEFESLEDAKLFFDKMDLKYYINNKYISVIEEINLIYKTDSSYKRLYKTITLDGELETNKIREI